MPKQFYSKPDKDLENVGDELYSRISGESPETIASMRAEMQHTPGVPIYAYHVLAKVTTNDCSDQQHFFVKASCASDAIELVELRFIRTRDMDHVQFTVKEATNCGSTNMKSGEEIYSL